MTRVNLTEMYPIRPDETAEAWTDRILSHATEHGTYRQCSLGWHEECSQRQLGADADCKCICHEPKACYYTVEGHAEGGTVTVTRVEAGKHHWPPVPGEPDTAWAAWIVATSPEDASAKAKAMKEPEPTPEPEPEADKPSHALQEACRHVLGHHHLEGGYLPGGFTAQLIDLWAKADMVNRYKLGSAFPEMAYAIDLFQNGQEDALRAVAEGVALR